MRHVLEASAVKQPAGLLRELGEVAAVEAYSDPAFEPELQLQLVYGSDRGLDALTTVS